MYIDEKAYIGWLQKGTVGVSAEVYTLLSGTLV